MSDIDKVDLLLNFCLLVIDTIDKNEFISKIHQIVLKLKNSIATNDFNVVSAVSKELAGESDFDSINVLASCIFENDIKNEQKLMFVLEVFYRIINRLYIKGYAKNVDSFFTEEPIDDDIFAFYNLVQEFEDCEILDKFEVLFL